MSNNQNLKPFTEGSEKKGGMNKPPKSPRPSITPLGQISLIRKNKFFRIKNCLFNSFDVKKLELNLPSILILDSDNYNYKFNFFDSLTAEGEFERLTELLEGKK